MSKFISLTGLEVNNPEICIKGNGNFACICQSCLKESEKIMDEWMKDLDTPLTHNKK